MKIRSVSLGKKSQVKKTRFWVFPLPLKLAMLMNVYRWQSTGTWHAQALPMGK